MPANVGNQEVTILYHTRANSLVVNRRHQGIRGVGIYSGGYLSKVDANNANLSILICEISDGTYQVKIRTQQVVNIAVAMATPYVVLRWVYTGSETLDFMDFKVVATPATNDLVVGKCSFTGGGALQGFDYGERSTPDAQNLFLKVEPTVATELRVRIRAGRIQNGKETIDVPDQESTLFVPPASNSRIDLVYVNRVTGAISIDGSGTAAASPVAPDYKGKLVLAEVTLASTSANITASMISDKRSFLYQSIMSPGVYAGEQSVTHANGMIFKHGYKAKSGGSTNVIFTTPFPNAIDSVSVTKKQASTGTRPVSYGSETVNGFSIWCSDSEAGYSWQAWGR